MIRNITLPQFNTVNQSQSLSRNISNVLDYLTTVRLSQFQTHLVECRVDLSTITDIQKRCQKRVEILPRSQST